MPKLMRLLEKHHDINPHDGSVCSWLLGDFISPRQLRDLAVMAFGNDLPSTVAMVKQLRLIGDGACPHCGSNDRDEDTGGFVHDDLDRLGVSVLGWRCKNCNHYETSK
jgi:hypothetical protein